MNTAPLDWQSVAADLAGSGWTVEYRSETGSTNDDAKEAAQRGAEHGHVILADFQMQGRGRRGTTWVSPPQRNLICSVVLRPSLPVDQWARLTQACALAVCEALECLPGIPSPQIKWPNDVYLSGKKVCGILVESVIDERGGFAVAGVGVNLNLTPYDFPAGLRETATSVWLESGGQFISREQFAADFLRRLRARCVRAGSGFGELLAACASRSFLDGKRVRLSHGGRELEGVVAGSGPDGELRLLGDDGVALLISSADYVRPV